MKNWKSFEALEETIRRDTVEVAKALHQSLSLVSKWKEQPATDEDFQQSGTRNPLDRIETIINTVEKLDPKRAHVPIKWLCARFGFMPPVKMPGEDVTDKALMERLLKWTKEFGETSEIISKSLEDGRISRDEIRDIEKEIREDIEAGMGLLSLLQERVR